MKTYTLKISSPDGDIFSGDVISLSLRGADGDLAVLADHIPFITSVQSGSCKIVLEDETEKDAHIGGGLLTVAADGVTLLASSFRFD